MRIFIMAERNIRRLDGGALWTYAVQALAGRAHSTGELREKLRRRAERTADVDDVHSLELPDLDIHDVCSLCRHAARALRTEGLEGGCQAPVDVDDIERRLDHAAEPGSERQDSRGGRRRRDSDPAEDPRQRPESAARRRKRLDLLGEIEDASLRVGDEGSVLAVTVDVSESIRARELSLVAGKLRFGRLELGGEHPEIKRSRTGALADAVFESDAEFELSHRQPSSRK